MSSTDNTTNTASNEAKAVNLELFMESIRDYKNPFYANIQEKVKELLANTYSPIEIAQALSDCKAGLFALAKDNLVQDFNIERAFNIVVEIDRILGSGIVEQEAAMYRLVQSRNPDFVAPPIQ
jgi:hypothetical protein